MAFKLSKELVEKLRDVHISLEDELAEMRDEYDEKSERWQESDKGSDVEAWFENLDEFIEALEVFRDEQLVP